MRHFYDHMDFVNCYHEKQPQNKKVCERGVRPMIRVLMMLAMAMAAYLVATMDTGIIIEID